MTAATQIVDVIIKAKRGTIHSGNLTANEMRIARAMPELFPKFFEKIEVENETETGFGNAKKRIAVAVRRGQKTALKAYLQEGQLL